MNCKILSKFIEEWAPLGAAWSKDNVGLQVGKLERNIKNVLVTLDINDEVVDEALKKDCNLIISHHPLLFYPIKKLNLDSDPKSQLIEKLILNRTTVISYHTNLDFTKDGVSFELAKKLNLINVEFLSPSESSRKKVVVYVPRNSVDTLSSALFEAGGGIIGNYEKCSNQIEIKGTFLGNDDSNPNLGEKGKFEIVDEVRLEAIFDYWNISKAVKAIKEFHPYEEPAFEIYNLENDNFQYGSGAVGIFEQDLTEEEFLNLIATKLNLKNFRYCKGSGKRIKRIAVCGGSGSDLLNRAISTKADAFITADIKYHTFQEAEGKICLIDAGHFETEYPILLELKKRLEGFFKENNEEIKVFISETKTNPIEYLKT